jgi:hypothetical protein
MIAEDYVPSPGSIVELCIGGNRWHPAIVVEMEHKPYTKEEPYQYRCVLLCEGAIHTIWHPQLIREV